MASRRGTGQAPKKAPTRSPARTPEEQEMHMVDLTVRLAEQQLTEGTASSQVMTHYLKLASSRERREQRKLELEMVLLEKKAQDIDAAQRVEKLLEDAMHAMRSYQGVAITEPSDYED